MRNLQRRVRRDHRRDIARDPVETVDRLEFEAARRHQLHADTDAEERLAAANHLLFQRLDHTGQRREAALTIGEGADAGQDDARRRAHRLGIAGDRDVGIEAGLARRALQRLRRRAQIAGAVIDDGNDHFSGIPRSNVPNKKQKFCTSPYSLPTWAYSGQPAGRSRISRNVRPGVRTSRSFTTFTESTPKGASCRGFVAHGLRITLIERWARSQAERRSVESTALTRV